MARMDAVRRDAGWGDETSKRHFVAEGVSAGVFSAIVMALILMLVSSVRGDGFFTPLELMGATLLRGSWVGHQVSSSVIGFLLHVAVGGGLGALFASMVRDVDGLGTKLAAGVAFGAGTFLVMTFLVLPWADPVMYYAIDKGIFFLSHLAFGFVLPLALTRHRPVIAPRAHEVRHAAR